jgi:hypothetical protein
MSGGDLLKRPGKDASSRATDVYLIAYPKAGFIVAINVMNVSKCLVDTIATLVIPRMATVAFFRP